MIRRLVGRFGRGARRLHDDEEGAAMIFAVITLFSLALAIFMVFQVGMVTTDRMQIQTAADAAAYSGAQVEANAINSIGQLNDGMTYVHYATLRYVLDNIVYGTLNAFRTHPQWLRQNDRTRLLSQNPMQAVSGMPTEFGAGIENKPAPDWVMLGDAAEWRKRWGAVERNGRRAVEEGKRWLQELDAAAHLILQKTPEMVREKAAEVAFLNGASHVAISTDLEEAFKANEDGRDEAGFIDGKGEGDKVASSLAFRYETRKLKVDGGQARKLSEISWFDPLAGKSRSPGYSQVRVCWNVNDWAHRSNQEQHADPQLSSTWMRSPNGHWHCRHEHRWIDMNTYTLMQVPHGGLMGFGSSVREAPTTSGGFGGGHMFPQDDDPQLHLYAQEGAAQGIDQLGMEPHHATVYCPTCMSADSNDVRNAQYSQVKKTQERADARRLALTLSFDSSPPRPLQIAQPLLRSGVTVAAWRESHGIGDLLPKSEWGMIALAAAQIGLMDDQGRVFALESITSGQRASYGPGGEVPLDRLNEAPYRNLFYSHDDSKHPGLRFGARLVPLRREESHHPKLQRDGAVDELLKGGGRWWTTSNPRSPAPSNMTQEAPPSLGALRQWVKFDDFRRVQETLWH